MLAAYVATTAALVATPGASTTVVVRNALDGGWRSGFATASGIALANTTHAVLTGAGVGLVLHEHPAALLVVSVLGAIYLAWLGVGSLRRAWAGAGTPMVTQIAGTATTASAGFREGLTVNLLNPAIMTFYLVVVPGFLPTPAPALGELGRESARRPDHAARGWMIAGGLIAFTSFHGAAFVGANVLYLKGGTKDHFMGFLRHAYPDMATSYERLYPGAYASPEYVGAVRALIDMLQERYEVNPRARRIARTEEAAGQESWPADPEQTALDF